MLLSFCLIFCQFHPGVAYKSVAYKKGCMCLRVKESLRSMVIPKSFTSLVLFISLFSTINVMLLFFINDPKNI